MAVPRSKISYCDYSGGDLNFVVGCTPASEGCTHCYARALLSRFGKDPDEVRLYRSKLKALQSWQPRGPWKRERPLAFAVDMADLFHPDVPFRFIDEAIWTMNQRRDVDWLILTKRPERMLEWWHQTDEYLGGNLLLGVTAENQERADERIPLLLRMPATVRWVSVEPMLGPVDLTHIRAGNGAIIDALAGDVKAADGEIYASCPGSLDWVIAGGESGPNRRAFEAQWAVDLYYQCAEADVAYWYKQGSAFRPGQDAELPGFGVVQEWPDA